MTRLDEMLAEALTEEERFWQDVGRGASHECWPWIGLRGRREKTGHVRIWFDGYRQYAHRVSYQLTYGPLEEGLIVRHSCDRGWCQNPAHLLSGTQADNVRDRDERNRRTPFLPRGAKHWSAKLTDAQAQEIRALRHMRAVDLASRYDVSAGTIYRVWNGEHYRQARAS